MSGEVRRPGRLRIGVVGAGRVGAVLAHALQREGHEIIAVSGQSPQSRERIDALLPGIPVVAPDEVLTGADLVLFAIPDDALGPIVQGFAALGLFRPGQIVVHTAGSYGTEVLEPAVAAGAIPIAIHPAMTFTGTSLDLSRIDGAPFAVTAGAATLPIGQALVVEMGGEPIVLGEPAREVYHAALAHGSNHLVTLVAQARRILEHAGVSDTGTLLSPLLHAALDGALVHGDHALTGPVRRGDAGTIAAHLAALAKHNPELLGTYRELARATTSRCLELNFLTPRQAISLMDVLEAGASAPTGADAHPEGTRVVHAHPEGTLVVHTHPEGTRVVHTIAELREAMRPVTRGVVMTMGALHDGHLELVRQAKAGNSEVIVTIFVNPLQFGEGEDLNTYPRTFAADVEKLEALGVDLVFAPSAAEMYPHKRVTLQAGEMGKVLEGASRPGHFDGMLTVVNKLLGITKPDIAYFGQKDAQQLALIRAMVADLNMDIHVEGVAIVRDRDGLALSSRNTYLNEEERQRALVIPRTIRAGEHAAAQGVGPEGVLQAARREFAENSGNIELDYLVLVNPETMEPYQVENAGPALLAIAAKVGNTRLLDNAVIEWPA